MDRGIKPPFLLYVGRIDVLAGPLEIKLPASERIYYAGEITEEEKWTLLHASSIFAMPSEYESVSITTLEHGDARNPLS